MDKNNERKIVEEITSINKLKWWNMIKVKGNENLFNKIGNYLTHDIYHLKWLVQNDYEIEEHVLQRHIDEWFYYLQKHIEELEQELRSYLLK
jgi:hypothetical protein